MKKIQIVKKNPIPSYLNLINYWFLNNPTYIEKFNGKEFTFTKKIFKVEHDNSLWGFFSFYIDLISDLY